MAKTPKPKTQQADGVLDDAAPMAQAAPAPEAPTAPGPAPEAPTAADPAPAAPVEPRPADAGPGELQVTHFVPPEPEPEPRIVVRALQPTRWRAGRCFTAAEPVSIDTADLTEGEIAALKADPMLSVVVLA